MESDSEINLKKYTPRKASWKYIIKVVIYTLVLFGLIGFITWKLKNPDKPKVPEKIEIDNFEIEIQRGD